MVNGCFTAFVSRQPAAFRYVWSRYPIRLEPPFTPFGAAFHPVWSRLSPRLEPPFVLLT